MNDALMGQKASCPSCNQSLIVPQSNRQESCVIGDFILREKLGAGSLATVYKSVQISLGREVALKVLSNEYTDFKGVSDFLKEARAAAKLNHPNLVQAYAVGEENGICYLAMDYVKGQTLKDIILSGDEIPIDKALHIIQQVAEALYYAWEEAEMIHRDVKPDNIMINLEGMAKLTDLGLAMNKSDWHEDMDISGSPSYMSPEQFAGEELDTRSDIYSLGITLYQILTRKLPFDGSTIRTIAKQHFQEEAVAVNKINKEIPSAAANLVKKMLAKSPDDRFSDMEELLKAIWQIRQKTAPSTEMIPNVHTISIKRLEYDIQNEKVEQRRREVEKERQVEAKIKNQNKSIRILFKLSIAALTILACAIGYHLLTTGQQQKADRKFSNRISNYEDWVQKNEISKEDFEGFKEEVKELKRDLKIQNSPSKDGFSARIKLILATAETKMLQAEQKILLRRKIKELNQEKSKVSKEIKSQKEADIKDLIQTTKTLQTLQTKKAEQVTELKSKLTNLASKTEKLETTKEEQLLALKKLRAEALNNWKNEIRASIYDQLASTRFNISIRFDVAKGLLSTKKQLLNSRIDSLKVEWLNHLNEWIINLEASYNKISSNGTKRLTASNSTSSTALLLLKKPIAAAIASPDDAELVDMTRAVLKEKLVKIHAHTFAEESKNTAMKLINDMTEELSGTDIFKDIQQSLKKLEEQL